MKSIYLLTSLLFMTTLLTANAQWFINKKNFPQKLMNYPNPGKRSLSEEELIIDCSIPYSYLNTYQEKAAWLLSCSNQNSPLATLDESSSSNSNSMEDESYSPPRLISYERRTARSIPPYLTENRHFFHRQLLNRLRRSTNE